MMRHYIVLADPANQFWRGAMVNDQWKRAIEAREGASLIPVYPEFLKRHPISGFMERHWGAGLELHDSIPRRIAGMALHLINSPGNRTIYWSVRLVPHENHTGPIDGSIRLAADPGTGIVNAGGLGVDPRNAADLSKLTAPDPLGGWTVSGAAPIMMTGDGHMCFMLWGCARGVKVASAAISQADDT